MADRQSSSADDGEAMPVDAALAEQQQQQRPDGLKPRIRLNSALLLRPLPLKLDVIYEVARARSSRTSSIASLSPGRRRGSVGMSGDVPASRPSHQSRPGKTRQLPVKQAAILCSAGWWINGMLSRDFGFDDGAPGQAVPPESSNLEAVLQLGIMRTGWDDGLLSGRASCEEDGAGSNAVGTSDAPETSLDSSFSSSSNSSCNSRSNSSSSTSFNSSCNGSFDTPLAEDDSEALRQPGSQSQPRWVTATAT